MSRLSELQCSIINLSQTSGKRDIAEEEEEEEGNDCLCFTGMVYSLKPLNTLAL
jgi:hypothetical protein